MGSSRPAALAALVAASLVVAPSAAGSGPRAGREDRLLRSLEAADAARRDAVLAVGRGDAAPFEAHFHESATLVGVGGRLLDRAGMLLAIRADSLQVTSWQVVDRRVERIGRTGIVTTRIRMGATLDGEDVSGDYWVRHVYARERGRWTDVSGQWTPIAGAMGDRAAAPAVRREAVRR